MKEITTLIPALGDLLQNTDWLLVVNRVFWLLLAVIAAGGIICAVAGKKSIINRGISGMLSIIMMYLTAIFLYVFVPMLRESLSELPFLYVDAEKIRLLDPAAIGLKALPPVLLRFFILAFFVNCMEAVWPTGEGFASWLVWRIVSALSALLLYCLLCASLELVFPSLLGRWAFIPVVLIIAATVLVFLGKLVFGIILSTANPYFGAVYGFFSVSQVGSQFSKTVLTTALTVLLLRWLSQHGFSQMQYAQFDGLAFSLTGLLCLIALYIFGMVFNEKKK